jgi:tyrosyl-tRNA synthetase
MQQAFGQRRHDPRAFTGRLRNGRKRFGNPVRKRNAGNAENINEATFLAIFDGVPQTDISRAEWENTRDVVELLSTVTQAQIYASKGEVRRAIAGGAVSINKTKVTTPEQGLDFELSKTATARAKGQKKSPDQSTRLIHWIPTLKPLAKTGVLVIYLPP